MLSTDSADKPLEERLRALINSSALALVIGRRDLPTAPPSKRAESEELFARVRAGESVNDFETVRQRKDGTLVDVSIAAAPVRDASGRVIGNMVACTDVSERKARTPSPQGRSDEQRSWDLQQGLS